MIYKFLKLKCKFTQKYFTFFFFNLNLYIYIYIILQLKNIISKLNNFHKLTILYSHLNIIIV